MVVLRGSWLFRQTGTPTHLWDIPGPPPSFILYLSCCSSMILQKLISSRTVRHENPSNSLSLQRFYVKKAQSGSVKMFHLISCNQCLSRRKTFWCWYSNIYSTDINILFCSFQHLETIIFRKTQDKNGIKLK